MSDKLYIEEVNSDDDSDNSSGDLLVDFDVEQDGGLLKTTVKRGTGYETPEDGAKVSVHYTGYLLDGTKFDSSKDRGRPFEFTVGQGSVIKGWDVGVKTMRLNEQATFVMKPEYAYGARGAPPKIPANATLKFEIELLSFNNEIDVMGDGDILLQITSQGDGAENPNDGATVTFHHAYHPEGGDASVSTFEGEPITVTLGEEMLPMGLDRAVMHLSKGARGLVTVQPGRYTLRQKNCVLSTEVPDDLMAPYVFDIQLVDFTRVKEGYEQKGDERIVTAKSFKDRGNVFFKDGQYTLAITRYDRGLQFIEYGLDQLNAEEQEQATELKVQCHLNKAACSLKILKLKDVLQSCETVLETDRKNIKALYRKAEALLKMKETSDSMQVLKTALEYDPENKAVKNLLAHAKKEHKAQLAKEKKLYSGMFQ